MAEKTNEQQDQGETQEQRDATEINKFAGFSTNNGEVQKPAGEKAAKGAKQAEGEGDEDAAAAAAAEGRQPDHKSAQERINKAVKGQRSAERERDKFKSDLDALNARLANLESGGNKPAAAPKEPDPKDYAGGEYDSKYLKDVAAFAAAKATVDAIGKAKKDDATAQQTTQQKQAIAAFEKARDAFLDKGADKFDDFEEVVMDDATNITQIVAELALDSEHGVDILYALAADPKEQKRVSAMTPARQAAWFGRREVELSSESQDADDTEEDEEQDAPPPRKPSKATKAPPAPKYNGKGTGGSTRTSPDTTDFSKFEQMAMASNKR